MRAIFFACAGLLPITALPQDLRAAHAAASPLETILVTARKVEEDLQDIPMSVDVLSADVLAAADVTHVFELQFAIPGLVVNNVGQNGAGYSIRGVSDQGGSSLSVATHVDGIYLGSSRLAIARLFDLERLEVLKGPQGTLYGRNATGGSINLITHPPIREFSAEIESAYGSFDTARTQGHVNVPVGDAAVRLAFIGSEGDGYIRNSVDRRKFAENDFWGLRGSVMVEPGDRSRFTLMVQHIEDHGATGELWSPSPASLVDPSDIRLTTVTLANPHLKTRSDIGAVSGEIDLGFANLHFVTGIAQSELHNLDDCAGTPMLQGCVRGYRPSQYEQWSQEIRLVARPGSRFEWIVGANYFDGDASTDAYQLIPMLNAQPLNDSHSTSAETAYAAFGQASWRFADRWSVTGGLRLNHESQRASTVGTGVQDSQTPNSANDSWDGHSWRVDLEFAATDDLLLYGGVATGSKSGGVTPTLLITGELDDFDAEELIAFETGIKSQWFDRRVTVNAAAFYYDFEDMQVSTVTFLEGRLVAEVDNAAEAELYGLDADAEFRLSDQLAVSAGLVWVPQREFVKYRNDRTGDTLSGNELTRAPEWMLSVAMDYVHRLSSFGNLSGRLEYNHRSRFFYTKENEQAFSQDGFGQLNLLLEFEPAAAPWRLFASGHNLTGEDYFHQVFFQSTPGYPETWEIGFGYRF